MSTDALSTARCPRPPDLRAAGDYYDHQIFDVMAKLWDGHPHYGLWRGESDPSTLRQAMDELTMELIRRLDPAPGDRVLDVGCGDGRPATVLARERAVEVVGVTASARQVARATERAGKLGLSDRVRFEQATAVDLPYDAESFDAAWAMESVLRVPDTARIVSEIARVVRPGADIAIAGIVDLAVPRRRRLRADPAHAPVRASPARIKEYRALFERAGLEVKDVRDVSEETSRTNDAFAADLESRRDEIVETIGDDGYQLIIANLRQLTRTPGVGYVLISAHRP